jgi:hypothetical protein
MKIFIFFGVYVVALLTLSSCDHGIGGCSPGPEPEFNLHTADNLNATEYEVYSVALKEKLIQSTKDPATIIVEQKTSKSISTLSTSNVSLMKAQFPEFDSTSITDYQTKNLSEYYLDYKFTMTEKYVQLITTEEIDNLFVQMGKNWGEYLNRYPYSNGYYTVSRIGFNNDQSQAVLAIEFSTGTSSTNSTTAGEILYLKKDAGVWKVVGKFFTWTT